MNLIIKDDTSQLGEAAGSLAIEWIQLAIERKGEAIIILATGTSQFETLKVLTKGNIDWSRVVMFHLDEYIGLPESSPASFRRYLKERFIQVVSPLKNVYLINGETDPLEECRRLGEIIKDISIDLALIGIGENSHIGFNDPPADFTTREPFIVVNLDEQCRRQQFSEGWYHTLEAVPATAITMSVYQIMKSEKIICSVPDSRKAAALRDSFENGVSPIFPASILQQHPHCVCFLDRNSSALLSKRGEAGQILNILQP